MADEKKLPTLADLTEAQKARLEALSAEIRYDKITVSFSMEDRDISGRKKSAFVSVTASRGHGAELSQMAQEGGTGFNAEEAKLVGCLVSKHVVQQTYEDAVRRRIMSPETMREEIPGILRSYDNRIARILTGAPSPAPSDDK